MNPYGSYKCVFNSSMNKRGTGILIKNNILFSELQRVADPEENFLLLKAEIKGTCFIIGSVYGPNSHDKGFFDRLSTAIRTLGCGNIILGGDWNCTLSPTTLIACICPIFQMLGTLNTLKTSVKISI